MATVQDVVTKIQSYMDTLAGVRTAPANVPDALNAFPAIVCLPARGNWSVDARLWKKGLHSIYIDVHIARKDAPRDYQKFVPFIELVPNKLMKEFDNDHWDSTIDAFRDIDYITTTFDYAGQDTVGLRFTINDIKMQSAIT